MLLRTLSPFFVGLLASFTVSLGQAATPPALSNPDATPEAPLGPEFFGLLEGSATVSAGGNAAYSLPIEVPPGTNGVAPNIAIYYNSNMKNGYMGLGWFIQGTHSKISRCPQTVSQNGQRHPVDFTNNDRFCLDGHQLVAVTGTYGDSGTEYRTEQDSFARVISHGIAGGGPEYFTVETKGGATKYYGNSADSRVELKNQSVVREWAMNRFEDRSGNYYEISYHEDNIHGESYPTEINYTGNDTQGLLPNAKVEFIYESRSDNFNTVVPGASLRRHPVRLATVRTSVNSVIATEYNMTYEEVGKLNLSRITQIERCDASGTCQKPLTMTWLGSGSDGFTSYDLAIPSMDDNTKTPSENYPRWHDLNGDGQLDYVLANPTGISNSLNTTYRVMLSSPSGYTTQDWTTTVASAPGDIHWLDVNADGLMDMVLRKKIGTYSSSKKWEYYVALSTGTGFNTVLYTTDKLPNSASFHFFDINGDYLPDYVTREGSLLRVRYNTGSSFDSTETNLLTGLTAGFTFGDFNGDGLTDVIEDTRYVRINLGGSFTARKDWGSSARKVWTCIFTNCYWHTYLGWADYNGDGLRDRKTTNTSNQWIAQLNDGQAFASSFANNFTPGRDINADRLGDTYFRTYDAVSGNSTGGVRFTTNDYGTYYSNHYLYSNVNGWNRFHGLADVNGDGLQDYTIAKTWWCHLVYHSYSNYYYSSTCETDEMRVYEYAGAHPNLLKKITNGLGGEVEFTYKPLTDHTVYTKGSGAVLPEKDVVDSTHVVSLIKRSDGIGGYFETEYTYEGLKRDLDGRGSLGFAKITSNNLDKNKTTITEYSQTFPHASQPTSVEVRRTSDNLLLSSSDTTYGVVGTVGSGPVIPYVSSTVGKAYNLGDGRLLSTTTTTNTVDSYGNITDSVVELNDHENSQLFKTQTISSFTNDVVNWRIGQLDNRVVKEWLNGSFNSGLDRTISFTYLPTTGLLESTIREQGKGAGIELIQMVSYDGYGNVTSETISGPGLASRSSSIVYDSRGQFPLSATNPLGHTASQTWEGLFGNKLTATDANGQTTSWTYNGFGHQTLETRPDGTTTSTYVYEDNSGNNGHTKLYAQAIASGKAPGRKFVDLLGREVRSRTQGFNGSYVNQDTEYDSEGRAWRSSEPYFDGDTVYWNSNTFDDLDRVTALTAADAVNNATSAYDGFEVAVTDNQGRTRTQTANAAGQIIEVIDKLGTTMSFTYDPAGNRIAVTNAVGTGKQNNVTYTYDRLGRTLTQNDPDHGVYAYTYDALGQKLAEVSPKLAAASQSIAYQYDLLGRMTSRTEPEGTTTWTYDNTASGNLGKGKLHSESQTGFSRTMSYGPGNYGRLTGTTTVIGAATYSTGVTYDSNGNVATETYPVSNAAPTGFQVAYTYNALGYLERVQAPGGSATYYQAVDTDAAGRMTTEWLGDGSLLTQAYQGQSSRLTSQHTQNGGTTVQNFTYTYDGAGNMLTRGDNLHSLSESFTFDNLDRLTSAQVAGQAQNTFGFDILGNITQKTGVGDTFGYTAPQIHAVNQLTLGSTTRNLAYDANGNLSGGADMPSVTWSSYNKPTQISKGAVNYQFSYGPDRKRYKKVRGSHTTHYVGSGFELITKGATTEYRHVVRANGRAVMLRKDVSGVVQHEYIHRDHLGSVTALTKESDGSVLERYSYDAWGLRRNASNWAAAAITAYEHRGYTGHEHLDEVGVIHMNGRIYVPREGRMLSPDPVTQAPESGQNYNRYSYANNNPIRNIDPSGYSWFDCAAAVYFKGASMEANGGCAETVADTILGDLFGKLLAGKRRCDADCLWHRKAQQWCAAVDCLAGGSKPWLDGEDFAHRDRNKPEMTAGQAYSNHLSRFKGDKVMNGEAADLETVIDDRHMDQIEAARGLTYNYLRGLQRTRSPDRTANLARYIYQDIETGKYIRSEHFYQIDPGRGRFANRAGLGNVNWTNEPPRGPKGSKLVSIVVLQYSHRWTTSNYERWANELNVTVVVNYMRRGLDTEWYLPPGPGE